MYNTLISTQELTDNLNNPDFVIVDCRFQLLDPSLGEKEYRLGHIPGAVYAHQDNDLASPITKTSGRHPLPEPAIFIETLRKWGIGNSSQVVVYDSSNGGMAARLWFLLKYYGHEAVAMLDGNLPQWQSESRPLEEGEHKNSPGDFCGEPNSGMVVSTAEVKEMLGSSDTILIDSRAPERYRGKVETVDTVAGHIPGAVNRFFGNNLESSGLFKSPETLKAEFMQILGDIKPQDAVIYCGSGPTSCHNLLAMACAGLPLARDYAGSWSEWIRDPDNPIEKG
jgi:thiosulfate/3-mercaptopyruvate sulfurtransferase